MAEDDLRDPRTLPHYILATLAGEQPEGGFNEELHTQNRIFWNNWAVQNLKKSQLNTLIEASIINPIDISKKTLDQIQGLARARGLKDIPSPSEPIDFSYTKWKFDAQFNKFFFPNISIFSHSKFVEFEAGRGVADWVGGHFKVILNGPCGCGLMGRDHCLRDSTLYFLLI